MPLTIPKTPEATWLRDLNNLPYWQPPALKAIVVAPHPDDETLGAGGLIAAQTRMGIKAVVLAVTDGEAAYPDQHDLGKRRRTEQERALAELGVSQRNILRLRLPDGGVAAREDELVEVLREHVTRATLLVAPWRLDPHPDHEACGRAAERVARESGAVLVSYFFWSWHYHDPEILTGLPLARFDLDTGLRAAREAALSHHHSQLESESGTPILPEVLLSPARRKFETFILAGRSLNASPDLRLADERH
jgi:LmbE family N-acetylglucosaminyl deacetylase